VAHYGTYPIVPGQSVIREGEREKAIVGGDGCDMDGGHEIIDERGMVIVGYKKQEQMYI